MRLKDYVTEALRNKLAKRPDQAEKPWMKFAGTAANDPEMMAELRRIEQIVDEKFEQIIERSVDRRDRPPTQTAGRQP